MPIRYSGSLRIEIDCDDQTGDGRCWYSGTVHGPKGQRWDFKACSPPPGAVPGPNNMSPFHPVAYDRAAAEALAWGWNDTRDDMGTEGWVFDHGEFHPDHETEDRFIVRRKASECPAS